MTKDEALAELAAKADAAVKTRNAKNGAGDRQFGVKMGDIRKLAKAASALHREAHGRGKPAKAADHALALELWAIDNIDARALAVLLLDPKAISADQLDAMVREETFTQVADWLTTYVTKKFKGKDALRERWMTDEHPMAARAGWSLTWTRIEKDPEGLDLGALLDRIEAELADADPAEQWTMNFCLAAIGIHHPEHRERALAIGEALGIYRDFPTSKGCTSPFAPIWINEMVSRQTS